MLASLATAQPLTEPGQWQLFTSISIWGRTFTALVAGWEHTCGLATGGTAFCWGFIENGQVGDGTCGADCTSPVAVSGGITFTALAAGAQHSSSISRNGTGYC